MPEGDGENFSISREDLIKALETVEQEVNEALWENELEDGQ